MSTEMWQRLRMAMGASGVTQAQMAKALGVTRPAIGWFVKTTPKGRVVPTIEQLRTIAKLTRVPFEMLVSDATTGDDINLVVMRGPEGYEKPYTPTTDFGCLHTDAPVQPPGGPEPRTRTNFWHAVEFAVVERRPDMARCFGAEVPPWRMSVSFVTADHLVAFYDGPGTAKRLIGEMMMFATATRNKRARMHLLMWERDVTPEVSAISVEVERAFGVRLEIVADGAAAADFLISLG